METAGGQLWAVPSHSGPGRRCQRLAASSDLFSPSQVQCVPSSQRLASQAHLCLELLDSGKMTNLPGFGSSSVTLGFCRDLLHGVWYEINETRDIDCGAGRCGLYEVSLVKSLADSEFH